MSTRKPEPRWAGNGGIRPLLVCSAFAAVLVSAPGIQAEEGDYEPPPTLAVAELVPAALTLAMLLRLAPSPPPNPPPERKDCG